MDLDTATAFARTHNKSVLVTVRRNGRPQLSNVLHLVGGDGLIRVSITADRAKYHNAVRDPWCAVHVTSDDFWKYVVIEGPVDLSEVAASSDDATVDELVQYYRDANGEHDDWDDYRAAMVADRRVMLRLRPEHAYGML